MRARRLWAGALALAALAGVAGAVASSSARPLEDLIPLPGAQPAPEPAPTPPAGPAPPRPDDPTPRGRRRKRRGLPRSVRLSDEFRRSRWAYVLRPTTARTRPSRRGRRLKRLRTRTEDGTPELVVAVRKRVNRDGRVWVKVRLPMRPNNTKGWVRRRDLGRLHTVRTMLRIDRGRKRATLYRRGRPIWRAPIGVGKPQWPTPAGRFYVRELLLPTDPGGIYGIFAFGTSAYSAVLTDWPGGGVVGIHGTNQPQLIPGRISHGCVRVRNRDMARLRRLMGLGTPIRVR
jgi:hypothetical protein